MNTAEITEQENRTLAKFPEMRQEGKINSNYGKEFESWLGDRFWGRDQLIDARFQTLYKINGRIENEKAFIGDDGWMFSKWNTVNRSSIKEQRKQIEKDAELLKKFANKFKEKNISIYLVIIPEREVLYQKYWEKYYKPKPQLDYGEEIKKLLKDVPIMIVNPQKKLIDVMMTEEVYYKDDGHLTSLGINILLNKVYSIFSEKEIKGVEEEPISTYEKKKVNHVARIKAELGFPDREEIDEKRYSFKYPNSKYIEVERSFVHGEYEALGTLYRRGEVKTPLINKNFIVIAGCYGEFVFDLFKPLYSCSAWIRTNMPKDAKKEREYNVQRIRELFNLDPASAVVVIIQGSFGVIEEALKE